MKIVIKKENHNVYILSLFFLVIFLFDYQLFYLLPFPSWLEILKNNKMNIVVGIAGIVIALYYYEKYKKQNRRLYTYMLKYASVSVAIWFILFLYSALKYTRQPVSATMGVHATFLYMMLAIPALVLFYNAQDEVKLFDIMNCISIVWYLIIIYQQIVYATSGTIVFNILELMNSSSREWTREYGIRISLKSLGNIMILYNFDVFFHKKKSGIGRNISLISLLLGLYCLVFIQQTRAMTLVVLCSIAAIMIFGAKSISKKLIVIAISIVGIGILVYTGILVDFFASFSVVASNSKRLGTTIRIGAILYYLQCFLEHPLLGNGFTNQLYYPEIELGTLRMFYYSDVGVFGLLGEVGLMIIPLYIYPVFRIVMNTCRLYKLKLLSEYSFLAGIVVYLLLSSITLVITARNMMIAFPIIYAYSEYVNAIRCVKRN